MNVTETNRAKQLYERVSSKMKKERWLEAIELLRTESAAVQRDWRLSWNLGWCYFKLDKLDAARKHMIRAATLAPENATCKWGLGTVYLKQNSFREAEVVLAESLKARESHLTRIALALALLSQGEVAKAENVHLEGLKLKTRKTERYESYAAFLSDVGREEEADKMSQKAKKLQRIN